MLGLTGEAMAIGASRNEMAAPEDRRAVIAWLIACCALVFAMVVVGGVTRLTHSGLSIVEWQPLVGTLPPLSEEQWTEVFDQYKKTPEYVKVNKGMSLAEFKGIFWWEYFHRLLGRLIGLAFFVPLAVFWARGQIDRPLAWKLLGIFVLGGLQGGMGWYMVKSGLVDDPRVSHFRLTAHLAIAFVIYGAILWTALDLLTLEASGNRDTLKPLRRLAWAITAVVVFMVLTGGLVAGIRAGFSYNTFPLMNGHVIPPEIMMLDPWTSNFFYNMATVQFDHRLGAWLLLVLVPWFWFRTRDADLSARATWSSHLLLAMLALQIALGVATLLLAVPVSLAAAHQGVAVLLFTAALLANHSLR